MVTNIEDVGIYLWSFLDKWFFWIGIVMLIMQLLEERLPIFKAFMEKWLPRLSFRAVALLLLLVASFQVWHEEKEQLMIQSTFMSLEAPPVGQESASIVAQAGFNPSVPFVEIDKGDYEAKDVIVAAGLEIQDFGSPIDTSTFRGSPQIEDVLFKKFRADFPPNPSANYEPHQENLVAAFLKRPLTQGQADGLIAYSQIIYVMGYVAWTDGSGRHEEETCQAILVGHLLANGGRFNAMLCETHRGLMNKPTD